MHRDDYEESSGIALSRCSSAVGRPKAKARAAMQRLDLALNIASAVVIQAVRKLRKARNGAEGGTRTRTGYPTRPSNVRVYQFHHFGILQVLDRRAL
jgi:hypothetical protein